MNRRISFFTNAAVVGFVFVALVSHAKATPISSGAVSLEFKNPPTPTAPWELAIEVWDMVPFPDGRIELRLVGATGEEIRSIVLWEGAAELGDKVSLEHSYSPPPPGMYMLNARLDPFPQEEGRGGASRSAYVLVTEDTVFLAWSGFRPVMLQGLELDIEKRGLGNLSPKELKYEAPDLAERWLELHGMAGVIQMGGPPKQQSSRDSLTLPPDLSDDSATDSEQDTPVPRKPDSQRTQFWDPDSLWPGWSAQQREFLEQKRSGVRRPATIERTPGDSEYGRSEEGRRMREEFRRFLDTTSIRYDTTSVGPDTLGG